MPQNISNWKEEFDKQFLNASAVAPTKEEVEIFISQTLQALATEMMEGVGEDKPHFITCEMSGKEGYQPICSCNASSFNEAKSEIRSAQESVAKKWGLV